MNEKWYGELGARLGALAREGPAGDFEKNARGLLASAFAKLDLVTREEYDAQTRVLERARSRLAALEARMAALEGLPATRKE